jgi:anaerobic dimethyl sulfoxide reductase subunit A
LYHIGTDGNAYGEGTETRDVLSSKLVVFWGYSVAAANGANVPYYFALARERGIPIIVIDSRYSWDAEIYADQWIPIRANTDTAMLLAVANVLFKEDLYDHDFVNKYVEPTGFQKWKDYVLGNTAGPDGKIDRTPEWAEIICGVPAQTIKEFARLFAKTTPCHFRLGIGPARREFGEDYASAGMCLMSMTGNVAKNGTYGFYSHARPTPRYVTPDQTAVYQKIAPTYKMPDLLDGSEKMGEALVKRDLFDKGAITQEQYNQYVSGRPGDPVPNIKMIWETVNKVCGSYPCTSKVIQGFKRVDFIVIYGGTYSDESLRYADLILPRVCGFFEEDAFHASSWETGPQFFVYHPAVINLPGEVAPTEWPLIQIANRLGFADKYNPRMKDVALDKWGQEMSKVSQQAYETWAARKDDIMPLNPPSWSNFQKSPVYRFFTGVPVPGYSTRLVNGFATKSKKIEFFSQDLLDPTRNSVNNSVNNSIYNPVLPMAMYDIAKDDFWSQDTKQYPLFCLLGPHSHYRQHSAHDANPWLNDEYRHACWISVADAKARTISDGDTVRVHNDTGEVIMPAYVTPRILPGIVAVPWGGYYEASQVKTDVMPDGIDIRGAGNVLTHDYPVRGGNLPARAVVQVEKF